MIDRIRPATRGQIAALLVALLVLGAGACSEREPAPLNVVIVVIDTLRADRLGCYGHERPTSPRIDALAAEGVLFERACASAPWTLPSVSSLFTGLLPAEHRVLVDGDRLEESVPTLAEGLASLGLATWSLHHNPYAGELAGLARGFQVCRLTERDTDGPSLAAFLAERPRSPFFLYVHNTEPHDPHEVARQLGDHRPFGLVHTAATAWSRSVRIRTPVSVTTTVCSKCADRLPSFVTAVHPSPSTFTDAFPAFTMGSMASTMPSARRAPRPAIP